ncbi:hypothetical protein IE81DRAFT_218828 [Ceraceosorus guamensis]|uniref:Uncharacterized protein n=1 Tax=Ceraceosorus guamensis TaxID=1522189 RepID=A0A316VYJ4_9BASI|nr:hypothetical protein IE81DRAFT_218828 [Ceraceosorus guamensis]PWN40545.1 hypothetical protein IE81DRAFT_218828 [Ceraceosorus guamensis]
MSNVSSSSGEQALGGGADSGSGVAVAHSHGLSHSLARRASSPTPTTPLTGVTSISSRPPSIAGSLALTDDSTRVVTGGASSSHPLQHYSSSSHQLNLENMHRQPASLTARNLGRIPDADEVAPGIRLPNEGVDDAHHHDHHDEHEQREREQERAEHQDAVGDSRLQKLPDGDASSPERSRERERFDRRGTINANFRSSSAHDAPLSDGTPLGSEAGAGDADRDERAYVGHYGEGGAPVARTLMLDAAATLAYSRCSARVGPSHFKVQTTFTSSFRLQRGCASSRLAQARGVGYRSGASLQQRIGRRCGASLSSF